MPPTLLAFVIMLGTFLLITLAAVARSVWHLFNRRGGPLSSKANGTSAAGDVLLLIGVAAAWYSVPMGWSGNVVFYPLYEVMAPFGSEVLQTFIHSYLSRVPMMLLPLGVMCLAWALLLWFPCRNVPQSTVWWIVGLSVAFVGVTPFAASAQSEMVAQGFSVTLNSQLMWSNGIRAVLFTLIGLLSLSAVRSRWSLTSNTETGTL